MSRRSYRLLWWACLPLLPVLAVQGKQVRKRVPRLPEAEGPRHGQQGNGRALSVAIVGESTAAGVGVATQSQGVAFQVAARAAALCSARVRWQTVGKTGATLSKVTRELLNDLSWPIEVVVVMVGANDAVRLTSEAKWADGAKSLAVTLQSRGARHVVFASVPPVGSFPALPSPLRNALGIRAKLLDATLREVMSGLEGASHAETDFPSGRAFMASDGFHPSELGYAEWAQQLAGHIASLPMLSAGTWPAPSAALLV